MKLVRDTLVSLDMLYSSCEVSAPLEVDHVFFVRHVDWIFFIQHFYLAQNECYSGVFVKRARKIKHNASITRTHTVLFTNGKGSFIIYFIYSTHLKWQEGKGDFFSFFF